MTSSDGDDLKTFKMAIKLLHSSMEDSADGLRTVLNSEIEKRYGKSKTVGKFLLNSTARNPKPFNHDLKKTSAKQHNLEEQRDVVREDQKHKDPKDKKHKLEEVQMDKDKCKTSVFKAQEYGCGKAEVDKVKISECRSTVLSYSAREGIHKCVICKQARIQEKLLECQECQHRYHKNCHHPPALDIDISDPRLVWYCAKCKCSMDKAVPAAVVGNPSSESTASETTQKCILKQSGQKSEEGTSFIPFRATKDLLGNTSSKGQATNKTSQPDLAAWFKTCGNSGQSPKVNKEPRSLKSAPSSPSMGCRKQNSSELHGRYTTSATDIQLKNVKQSYPSQNKMSSLFTNESKSLDHETKPTPSKFGTQTKICSGRQNSKAQSNVRVESKAEHKMYDTHTKTCSSTSSIHTRPSSSSVPKLPFTMKSRKTQSTALQPPTASSNDHCTKQ